VAKGSFLNKAILVPAALAISAFAPWAVTVLLMLGGLYLCFEGVEKLAHRFLHTREEDEKRHEQLITRLSDPSVDLVALEKDKIKGAIRTDFILSAEIIVIALGIVATQPFVTQVGVLVTVAVMITVVVYGLVAGIVKLDDLGLHLSRKEDSDVLQALGRGILRVAPILMKALSIFGTAAMILVGGGILAHGIPGLGSWIHHLTDDLGVGLEILTTMLLNGGLGIIAGAITVGIVTVFQRMFGGKESAEAH
jgi:predicted DNA repair protein MutK